MSSLISLDQKASLAVPSSAPTTKRKRGLPGNPDPDAEVMSLSPRTLMAKNRFMCEICSKGFQRDQNLQLHMRGHNLPWKLKKRTGDEVIRKKVYVCPEISCVHHDPSRALGDLTGIKKHFSRKHGEKKWKCEKCSKKYAVQSDWKAHSKICGTREYRCDCGTLFSRRDSFITHRAFCDALADESARSSAIEVAKPELGGDQHHQFLFSLPTSTPISNHDPNTFNVLDFSMKEDQNRQINMKREIISSWPANLQTNNIENIYNPSLQLHPDYLNHPFDHDACSSFNLSPQLSATALLQKAARMGATASTISSSTMATHHTAFGIGINSDQNSMSSDLVLPNPSLFQEMMNIGHGSLEEMSSSTAVQSFQRRSHERSSDQEERRRVSGNNNGDGLTRDFLGIRPFSHKDILNMAGLSPCVNSYTEQPRQNGDEPWQQG